MARTYLLHVMKRWPDSVRADLWPYAICMASEVYNNAPCIQNDAYKTPLQIVSHSNVNINSKHYHTFGCPAYVLDSDLQQGKPYRKWKNRAEVGIYIGRLPHHNRNVGLVLNRKTGLVSPQFHKNMMTTLTL